MLKVEQYGGPKVETQISNAPIASTNAPAIAFSGNALAAVADTTGDVMASYQAAQKRVADTEAEAALVSFERDKNKIFFDPKEGYFNTQGRDALDRAPDVNKQLEELKRNYSGTLKTEMGRQAFDRVANKHITSAQQDIMQHGAKGMRAWETSTAEAALENTVENASLYWNDSKRLGIQMELGRQGVLDLGKLKGLPPESVNEKLQSYNSAFLSSAIHAATQSSSVEGKALFDKYETQLEGPDVVKIKQMLDTKVKSEQVKSEADYTVNTAGGLIARYAGRDDARTAIMDDINAIQDPKLRNSVMKESMYQLNMIKQARVEESAAIFDDAIKFTGGGGTAEQFKSTNPEAWNKMTGAQQQQLIGGKGVVNDYDTYFKLISQSPDRLAQINPAEYAGQLDTTHREKLATAVLAARKGQADGTTSRDQLKKDRLYELMGKKTMTGSSDIEKFNGLNRTVDAMIESKMRETGKSFLSDDEYRKVLSDFSRGVVKERSILPDTTIKLDSIPADELDAYSEYLRANDQAVTTKNLLLIKENASHREAALKGR